MRDKFGENNHLVVTMEQGRNLAAALGGGNIALMKRHGCVVTGMTVAETVEGYLSAGKCCCSFRR